MSQSHSAKKSFGFSVFVLIYDEHSYTKQQTLPSTHVSTDLAPLISFNQII